MIYLIGSLSNLGIRDIANRMRREGLVVFDDWISGGSDMDRMWQEYEKLRGRSYKEALKGFHARNVFRFDKSALDKADCAVLIMPCGRSGHIELGYVIGTGRPGYILFESEPERFDQMYQFCTDIFFSEKEMIRYFSNKNQIYDKS